MKARLSPDLAALSADDLRALLRIDVHATPPGDVRQVQRDDQRATE